MSTVLMVEFISIYPYLKAASTKETLNPSFSNISLKDRVEHHTKIISNAEYIR
ncbi:hypothetical protein [Sutcliffiella rhizosphaerae]|uniref:hypothetical protein n=1 Tax=Sutcliffiella rhizosphaerae TaxID=2880967 RepID=UPI001E307E2F|nr:hypothetical protein [Sutcliffiella rhizosphaerae]